MPPPNKNPVTLLELSQMPNCIPFLEQAVGQIATQALLEVGNVRLKYPGISVRETSLKYFSLFLKANNPSNTPYLKDKYTSKIKLLLQRCSLPA